MKNVLMCCASSQSLSNVKKKKNMEKLVNNFFQQILNSVTNTPVSFLDVDLNFWLIMNRSPLIFSTSHEFWRTEGIKGADCSQFHAVQGCLWASMLYTPWNVSVNPDEIHLVWRPLHTTINDHFKHQLLTQIDMFTLMSAGGSHPFS